MYFVIPKFPKPASSSVEEQQHQPATGLASGLSDCLVVLDCFWVVVKLVRID